MNYTGFAGELVGWAIMITAYCLIILGLFCAWSWIFFEVIVRNVFTWMKIYEAFMVFIWDFRRNKAKYRKRAEEEKINSEPNPQERDARKAEQK